MMPSLPCESTQNLLPNDTHLVLLPNRQWDMMSSCHVMKVLKNSFLMIPISYNLWSAARVPQVPQCLWVTADEPLNMGFRTLGSQPTKGGAASSAFLQPLFDVYMPAPPVRSVLKQPSNNLPGEFGFSSAWPFGPCAPSKLDGCIDNHLKDD